MDAPETTNNNSHGHASVLVPSSRTSTRPSLSCASRCGHASAATRQAPPASRHATRLLPSRAIALGRSSSRSPAAATGYHWRYQSMAGAAAAASSSGAAEGGAAAAGGASTAATRGASGGGRLPATSAAAAGRGVGDPAAAVAGDAGGRPRAREVVARLRCEAAWRRGASAARSAPRGGGASSIARALAGGVEREVGGERSRFGRAFLVVCRPSSVLCLRDY
jgi:hypothetical protein